MDPIRDLLVQRAEQLDVGRQDELALIQLELDRLFKHRRLPAGRQVSARKLDHDTHTLTIEVANSSLASVVRLSQIQILSGIKNLTREPITKIIIRIK